MFTQNSSGQWSHDSDQLNRLTLVLYCMCRSKLKLSKCYSVSEQLDS